MTIRLSARQKKRGRRDSEHSSGKVAVLKCSFREVNTSLNNSSILGVLQSFQKRLGSDSKWTYLGLY